LATKNTTHTRDWPRRARRTRGIGHGEHEHARDWSRRTWLTRS